MYTISDIIMDIKRGCMANNMVEDTFSYRIVFFVNEGSNGTKYYVDTTYNGLRESLENIIRSHLSVTNSVVVAQTTVLRNGKSVSLQSRSYAFSLEEFFKRINGECSDNGRRGSYNRYAMA